MSIKAEALDLDGFHHFRVLRIMTLQRQSVRYTHIIKKTGLPSRLAGEINILLSAGKGVFLSFCVQAQKPPSISCRAGFGGGRFCRFSLAVDDHEDCEDVHDADGNIQRHLLPEDNHQNEET